MTPNRGPYLLPHERYLMNRFYKAQYESKLPSRGSESAAMYVASSADGLVAWVIAVPGLLAGIIGGFIRAADVHASAITDVLYASAIAVVAAVCLLVLAIVRVIQSGSAYHRYRRNLDSEHPAS